MNISGTCGNRTVNSLDELLSLLSSCRKGDFGEFYVGKQKYPAMLIHINGNMAYLHFFPADRHPGFQTVGDLSSRGEVTFREAGHGDFSMPMGVVISLEKAYQAATEFFTNERLPNCVEWMEL